MLKLSPPASNVADRLRVALDFSTLFFCFCFFDGILIGLTGMSTSQGTTRLPYRAWQGQKCGCANRKVWFFHFDRYSFKNSILHMNGASKHLNQSAIASSERWTKVFSSSRYWSRSCSLFTYVKRHENERTLSTKKRHENERTLWTNFMSELYKRTLSREATREWTNFMNELYLEKRHENERTLSTREQ